MAFHGIGLDSKINELNLQFKMHLRQKGGIGIRSLGKIFNRVDFNGNKKLDMEEFKDALALYGIFPSVVELQALMKYYDVDGDGNISYEEFLRGLRDELTERRKALVEKAFSIMDKDGSGVIQVVDISEHYDVSFNEDYLQGIKTKEEVLEDFLDNFDGAKGNNDGQVTFKEWMDYYTDLSISVPSDDYFALMMNKVWGLEED